MVGSSRASEGVLGGSSSDCVCSVKSFRMIDYVQWSHLEWLTLMNSSSSSCSIGR